MAYDWFRFDASAVDHPKTHRLEAMLSDPNAFAYVARMWSWLVRYAARGRLRDIDVAPLESACKWRGPPGHLMHALIACGWVDECADGMAEAHDWWEKQGAIVLKAEKDAARKRKQRRADGAVTARAESAPGAVTARVQDETRRDETEQEKKIAGPTDPPPLLLVGESLKPPRVKAPPDPKAEWERFRDALTVDEGKVFEAYELARGVQLGADWRLKKLVAQKLEAHPVEELCAAVVGYFRDDFRRKTPSLGAIFRDSTVIASMAAEARRR